MTTHHSHEHSSDPLARRVLERIEHEHLTPRPRWEFLFKNYIFWTLGALAVALGAFAFSAALFEVTNASWNLYEAIYPDFFTFFLHAAPFLWIVVLGLFVTLGYATIRHTKRGYRYPLAVLALGAVMTSFVLGTALYVAGAGEVTEEVIGDHPPFYRPIIAQERAVWQAPQNGTLAGEVLSVATGTDAFVLKDFSGDVRNVDARDLRAPDVALLSAGNTVRVVGTPVSATSTAFHACFVFDWSTQNVPPPPLPKKDFQKNERSSHGERSDICKGIRPYGALRALHGE